MVGTFSAQSASVMSPGADGAFDETGQADPTVVYDGAGDWKMWFDARNASDEWLGIGYATSADGLSWTKVGEVLSVGAPGAWDDAFVHHPCVHKHNGTYYMYYSGSDTGSLLDVGLATSPDGTTWTKSLANPVLEHGPAGAIDEGYIRPASPVLIGDLWWMFYWAADAPADGSTGSRSRPHLTSRRGQSVGLCGSRPPRSSPMASQSRDIRRRRPSTRTASCGCGISETRP